MFIMQAYTIYHMFLLFPFLLNGNTIHSTGSMTHEAGEKKVP